MKKLFYVAGFLAFFLIGNGILFKIMHWPSASMQLCMGILLLNLGYLPAYFYNKYKANT
ncbi:hypothetical protein [Flavobacterium alkalisoli]|uniref:hypothetical protein n=1 Tax=Flavobacterium alkalisoli TaxID=2602769 RepID=UPI00143CC332|nr:hypothetical protein [Flavobacterium alkalisoli]